MIKKVMKIAVIIIISIIILLALSTLLIWLIFGSDKAPMMGYFVVSQNDLGEERYLIIHSDNGATIMSNRTDDETLFDNFQTGDRVIIKHGSSILLSDPSQTGVYGIMRIRRGSINNLPQKAYDKYKAMGWIRECRCPE